MKCKKYSGTVAIWAQGYFEPVPRTFAARPPTAGERRVAAPRGRVVQRCTPPPPRAGHSKPAGKLRSKRGEGGAAIRLVLHLPPLGSSGGRSDGVGFKVQMATAQDDPDYFLRFVFVFRVGPPFAPGESSPDKGPACCKDFPRIARTFRGLQICRNVLSKSEGCMVSGRLHGLSAAGCTLQSTEWSFVDPSLKS